ncbi:MAG TPA: shikimate dehydrogenase [Candidatus Aquilonibacter sp.]|nr:shikimate dehydrogenase [Candidatus Aquilonibacter sp.]
MLGRDKVCAVVAAQDASSLLAQLGRALRRVRAVELRLDWLSDDHEIDRFLRSLRAREPTRKGVALLATCRRFAAGGRYRGTIAKQLIHLADAIRAGCAWYDLEVETARECPGELIDALLGEGRRLASAHFFERMPKNLARVASELGRGRPDAIKIAAHCDSLADGHRLLNFARKRRDIVAIPMGEVALPARILALRERNSFAYAPVENATAPGQVSLAEMLDVYRADRLDARTSVYGVIGSPIGHSLSPAMQNAGFAARRINAVYVPFLVQDLHDFLASIEPLGVRGFSVTLPHKEKILRHLDDCDPLAARIGAVNTVVVRDGGNLYGYNTDYVGVLQAFEKRIPLRGSRVLIVGAGGAARAVAFALEQAGAAVCVTARRPPQAKALAKAVGGEAILRNRIRHEFFDAVVNATPVGMHPAAGNSPFDARELNCRLVFDTIYRPRRTRLLQLAASRGIETVSGVEMFVAQGTAQWEIWTGERAPIEPMRRAVIKALDAEEKSHSRAAGRKAPREAKLQRKMHPADDSA